MVKNDILGCSFCWWWWSDCSAWCYWEVWWTGHQVMAASV